VFGAMNRIGPSGLTNQRHTSGWRALLKAATTTAEHEVDEARKAVIHHVRVALVRTHVGTDRSGNMSFSAIN
jgi:hypothetical protein